MVVEQVTPVAPVVVPPTVVDTAPVAPQADSWELKYKVLNGKYTAEVPRMAQELRDLREQLRVATTTPAPAATVDTTTSAMTPDSVTAQYGEDFTAAVNAIAEAKTKSLRDELSSKVEVIEVDTAQRARGDFIRDLTSLASNWESIDRDPGFTAYLDEFDAQTGRVRREFFDEADRTNNAARVATFFAAYAKSTAPAPKPVVVVPRVEVPSVDHLISPDSSAHSEAPEGKKLWTKAEVNRFYADARAQGGSKPYGIYTAEQFARIDADISAAPGENRYIG